MFNKDRTADSPAADPTAAYKQHRKCSCQCFDSMQPSNTKKRRLQALQQHRGSGLQGSSKPGPAGAAPLTKGAVTGSTASLHSASFSQQGAAAADEQDSAPQFPYVPLAGSQSAAHIASRLQLPASTACKGNVEDVLEALMVPQMSRSVAQQMIAVRTASDKAVTLVNPTGRVNLARPSASSRGQHQHLSGKLLPRAQRAQLAALPKSGIDYGAMMALHDLWCKYVSGVLTNASPDSMDRLLQAIDWHGALVRVVASKNPIYVHRVGIVAMATQNTFVVVSDDGRSSIVPLKGSSFECSFECGQMLHVLLSGDSLKVLKCELQGG